MGIIGSEAKIPSGKSSSDPKIPDPKIPEVDGSVLWKGADATGSKAIADVYKVETKAGDDTTRDAKDVPEGYTLNDGVITQKNFTTTNTSKMGDLQVSKIVTGDGADEGKEFTFTVTLDTKVLNNIKLDGTFDDMTFADNVAMFTLKGGESKKATGLPAGVSYTLAEEDYSADGYTTTSEGAVGTIEADKTASAAFTNYSSGTAEEPEPEYEPSVPVEVVMIKHLKDALIHEEEFSFDLYDEEGKQQGEAIHTTLGIKTNPQEDLYTSYVEIKFAGLSYTEPGVYNYTIRDHMAGTTQVVEGDEWNQAGFEPGFYKGGVKYDDKEYPVVVTVVPIANGQLEASVVYPTADGDVHELVNEYSEEYVEIDGNDEHPNDGLHEDEPSKENKGSSTPKTNKPPAAKQSTTPKTGAKTGDTTPVAPPEHSCPACSWGDGIGDYAPPQTRIICQRDRVGSGDHCITIFSYGAMTARNRPGHLACYANLDVGGNS